MYMELNCWFLIKIGAIGKKVNESHLPEGQLCRESLAKNKPTKTCETLVFTLNPSLKNLILIEVSV